MSVRKDTGPGPESARRSPARTSVDNAVEAAKRYLIATQAADGHWVGELEGDTILESEYILTMHFLGRTGEERVRKTAEHLQAQAVAVGRLGDLRGRSGRGQLVRQGLLRPEAGGRRPERCPHGARPRDDPVARRDRGLQFLHADLSGDLRTVLVGRHSRGAAGDRSAARIVSSSTSTRCRPGRAASSCRCRSSGRRSPHCPVPDFAAIPELRVGHAAAPHVPRTRKERSWRRFFTKIDHTFKRLEAAGFTPLRQKALEACEAWIHERLALSDGLGAIFPPIINTIIAFRCLGYALDDPRLRGADPGAREARARGRRDAPRPALLLAGLGHGARHRGPLGRRACRRTTRCCSRPGGWLLDREVKQVGDWKKACPAAEPGGWYFEYANEWYPDTDDTAEVLTALSRVRFPARVRGPGAAGRGRPRPAPGCSRCRTATAAGAPSTRTATTRSSPTSPSPTTTP